MKKGKTRILSVIDVGTSKVAALIAGVNEDGSLGLIGVGVSPSEGMKKGVVTDIDKVAQSVYQAVNAAEKMANHVVVSAIVGISGNHVAISASRGMTKVNNPERGITREDMRRAVEVSRYLQTPADKQIIDIIEQEYTVDGQGGILDPERMAGNRLEVDVQIVTGTTAFVQNLIRCITKLNIEPEMLVLAPLTSGEAVLNEDEKEIGTVLIDFGAGTTGVAVFKNKMLKKSRIFPVGSRHIDSDIAIRLSVSLREAERLKLEYGMAYVDARVGSDPVEVELVGGEKKTQIPRGMLCETIYERVRETVKMVAHDLETDLPMSVTPANVVITGGGAKLEGLPQLVEQILGMNVRVGRPIYEGDHAGEIADPSFAAALGLLRYAARTVPLYSIPEHGGGAPGHWLRMAAHFFRGLFK